MRLDPLRNASRSTRALLSSNFTKPLVKRELSPGSRSWESRLSSTHGRSEAGGVPVSAARRRGEAAVSDGCSSSPFPGLCCTPSPSPTSHTRPSLSVPQSVPTELYRDSLIETSHQGLFLSAQRRSISSDFYFTQHSSSHARASTVQSAVQQGINQPGKERHRWRREWKKGYTHYTL